MQNPQTSDLRSSYNNCSQFSLSQYVPINKTFWLNYSILSEIRNTDKSICDQSFKFPNIYIDGVYNILTLIDRSKLILSCINSQNIKIKKLIAYLYKSASNYEKIKLIDLIKLLIINQKVIDEKLEYLEQNQSCFAKEILNHVLQLNEMSQHCVDFQINEDEITKEFRLSSYVIDKILNDCRSDLSEIEKNIYEKQTEFHKKLKSVKEFPLRRVEKSRYSRHCDRMLQFFRIDLSQNIIVISKILNRLCQGHCSSDLFRTRFVLTETELGEYQVEISLWQLQRIVAMKYTTMELENKMHEHILEITGLQMQFANDDVAQVPSVSFGDQLVSPVGSPLRVKPINTDNSNSFVTSTPAPNKFSKRFPIPIHLSLQSVDKFADTNDDSISSFDSGYLVTPGNEQASLRDSCDNLDVIPFSDDEYEKIEDDEKCQLVELDMHSENVIDSLRNSMDSISVSSLMTNAIDFCHNNNFCRISRCNKRLFSINQDHLEISLLKKIEEPWRIQCLSNSEVQCAFDLQFDLFPIVNLCDKEKEDLRQQITGIVENDKLIMTFSTFLEMAALKAGHYDSDNAIEKVLQCVERLWKYSRDVGRQCDFIKAQYKRGFDNQNNNSACSAYIVTPVNAILDQNTNNNADSRDEENLEDRDLQFEDGADSDGLDAELRDAFDHILSDTTPINNPDRLVDISDITSNGSCSGDGAGVSCGDLYGESRFRQYRDVTVNSTMIPDMNWQESSPTWTDDESLGRVSSGDDIPGPVDDLDLVLKLSELHLGSEFRAEQHNRSVLVADRNRVICNYFALAASVGSAEDPQKRSRIRGEPRATVNHDQEFLVDNVEGYDRGDGQSHFPNSKRSNIGDLLQKESNPKCLHGASVNISLGDSETPERSRLQEIVNSNSQTAIRDNSQLKCADRVTLTVKLAGKLLEITGAHLKFVNSMFHNNSCSTKSTILRNRSLLVSCLHQRLEITARILSNMRLALQTSNKSKIYDQTIPEIDNLLQLSKKLLESSIYLKTWMKRNGYEIDKVDGCNFQPELPDDLLIKMDPNDFKGIVTISSRRLQATIEALSPYPCHGYLLNLYHIQFEQMSKSFIVNHHTVEDCVHHLDLVQKLCKLRRVHAICAFNIVDLHVLLTKLESEHCSDYKETEANVKNLLAIWRAVDVESHRLLKCSSLVHHVMSVARHQYIDMISLIAVMQSVVRTIQLSEHESNIIRTNIDTLLSYKYRVVEWLEEVDHCVAVIYEKRMTSKRFQYYDDIHNYIEVNLKAITELVDKIKNECQKAVDMVYEVVGYCSSLPDCSITYLGNAVTSRMVVDNLQLLDTQYDNGHINGSLFNAIVDLEDLTTRISNCLNNEASIDHVRDLITQGQDILKDIDVGNANQFVLDSQTVAIHRASVSEIASEKINEKILEIASKAATNALLSFVEKFDICAHRDAVEVDKQSKYYSTVLGEITEDIIEDLSGTICKRATMTELNSSRGAFQHSHKTGLQVSVTNVTVEEPYHTGLQIVVDEGSILSLCEQLRCQLISSCIEELQLIDNRALCVSRCTLQIEDSTTREWHSMASVSVHIEMSMNICTALQLLGRPVLTADEGVPDCSGELETLRAQAMHNVPVSCLKQSYDSHELFKSFTRLFDSKPRVLGHYTRNQSTDQNGKNLAVLKTSLATCCRPAPINRITKLVAKFSQPYLSDHIDIGHHDRSAVSRVTLDQISLELLYEFIDQLVNESARRALTELRLCVWVLQLAAPSESGPLPLGKLDWPAEEPLADCSDRVVAHKSQQVANLETVFLSSPRTVRERVGLVSIHVPDEGLPTGSRLTRLLKEGEQISRSVLTEVVPIDYSASIPLVTSGGSDLTNEIDLQQPITSCSAISMTTSSIDNLVDLISEWNGTESKPASPVSIDTWDEGGCRLLEIELSMESILHNDPPPLDEKTVVSSLVDTYNFFGFEVISVSDVATEQCGEVVHQIRSAHCLLLADEEPLFQKQPHWQAVSDVCTFNRLKGFGVRPQSTDSQISRADTVAVSNRLKFGYIDGSANMNCSNRFSFSNGSLNYDTAIYSHQKRSVPIVLTVVLVILFLLVAALCVCLSPLGHWCSCLVPTESLFPKITTRGVPF